MHVYTSCAGDGILDSQEGIHDVDGDGILNFLDIDSDGEPEHAELQFCCKESASWTWRLAPVLGIHLLFALFVARTNQNSFLWLCESYRAHLLITQLPPGDGILDATEFNVTKLVYENMTSAMLSDPDGDGIPNWWDLDSDNDLLPDSKEGHVQTNALGLPLFLDPRVETTEDDDIADVTLLRCVSRCPSPAIEAMDLNADLDTDNDGGCLCMAVCVCV